MLFSLDKLFFYTLLPYLAEIKLQVAEALELAKDSDVCGNVWKLAFSLHQKEQNG